MPCGQGAKALQKPPKLDTEARNPNNHAPFREPFGSIMAM
jgi:hypothetical protein